MRENRWFLNERLQVVHSYNKKDYPFCLVMRLDDWAFNKFIESSCIYDGDWIAEEEYKMIFTNPNLPQPEENDLQYHLADVTKHIENVAKFIGVLANDMVERGATHDASKFKEEEISYYAKYTPNLKGLTYGSEEYKENLKKMEPAIQHHYANNTHHPEHYPNGINDMDLVDIVEMICDWKAASMRHNDGNIMKSLEINKERFKMDDQLFNILKNTVDRYFK
jgi:hypothetical protein